MQQYLKLLAGVIGPYKGGLVTVFSLFILLSFLEAIGVGLVVPLVSSLDLGGSNSTELAAPFNSVNQLLNTLGLAGSGKLFILLVIIFYLKAVLGYFTQRAVFNFGYRNQKRLIDDLVKKYQSMSVSEFTKQESSALIQNLIGNVEVVCLGSIIASIRFISEIVVIISITIVLFFAQPTVSLFMVLLIIVVVMTYDKIFRRRIRLTGEQAAQSRESVIKNFQSVMQGFKEIHVIGRLDYFNRLIFEGTAQVKESAVEYKSMSVIPRYLMESMAVTGFAAIFLIGSVFGLSQTEIIAIIGIFAVAALRLIPGANQVASTIIQMRNSHYALKKVHHGLHTKAVNAADVISMTGETSLSSKPLELSSGKTISRIEFKDVLFQYEGNSNVVLDHVNFSINRGDLVGLMGTSGSGKSTTLDLLLGFFTPTSGVILVDDKPLSEYHATWRNNFAYVVQEPFLFSGSIKENITLGVEHASRGVTVDDAIHSAGLGKFISSLPKGVDSYLGERGVNLSGGQRQRIAIARAFYLDRPIIILDEPTSALDNKTSLDLMEVLASFKGKKTIIVISHDSEIMTRCDKVYEFRNKHISLLSESSMKVLMNQLA